MPIGETGAFDCPDPDVDTIDMFGVCAGGEIGAYFGLSDSVCFAFDRKGFGLIETGGSHEGVVYGGFLGGGIILSDGDMEDQKEALDYLPPRRAMRSWSLARTPTASRR